MALCGGVQWDFVLISCPTRKRVHVNHVHVDTKVSCQCFFFNYQELVDPYAKFLPMSTLDMKPLNLEHKDCLSLYVVEELHLDQANW